MSAPDRTFHTCSRYYMPECKANIPAKNCYDVSDAEAFSRKLQKRAKELLGMTGKANDRQEGGSHYKTKAIQPWDYISANGLGFFDGNVVKYVTRFRDKNGIADLRKARHYLDKLIEVEEAKIVGNG